MVDDLDREYAKELARAAGGAILFSFPLLMTMEMWWLGFYMDRARLALFVGLGILMLVGLSRRVGFSERSRWFDDVGDALSAYGVGVLVSMVMLYLFNVLGPGLSFDDWVARVAS